MNSFYKLSAANLKEFLRDRTAVLIMVLVPVFFVAFFGMAFGGMEDGKYNVGLVVEDRSSLGEAIAQAIDKASVFAVTRGNREGELDALLKGKRRAVIVVPEGIGAAVSEGRASLAVHYDASQMVAAQTILGVVRQIVSEVDRQITGRTSVLTVSEVSQQTKRLRNIDFVLPGILAMALMWLGIFNSLPLVKQRQTLVLKRYNATPLSRGTVVSAQVISRLLISVVQATIIIAVGILLFRFQNQGSWLLVGLLVVVGTLVFVALGYVIAAIARTEEAANGLCQLVNFPLMFLSGVFFPTDVMPAFLSPVIQVLPLTYLNDAFRQVMLSGAELSAVLTDIGMLVGWIVVCLAVSIRFFRWT